MIQPSQFTAWIIIAGAFIGLFSWPNAMCADVGITLNPMNIDPDRITLSGFASGGNLAQQLYISHSSLFNGLAVFSDTYYRCGGNTIEGDINKFQRMCTKSGVLEPFEMKHDSRFSLADIKDYFDKGLIDDPFNLKDKPLYVYAGTRNQVYSPDMSFGVIDIFQPFIKNPKAILTRVQSSDIILPSESYGELCPRSAENTFYIGNCGLNGPFEALKFLLENIYVLPIDKGVRYNDGSLVLFNQTEFFSTKTEESHLDDFGFIYVPYNCRDTKKQCLLHLYFHGCTVGREFVGRNHILKSGYLQLAEANNIIMLFPQAKSSPENMNGCWDNFGLTSPLYATKAGPQVSAMRSMIEKLSPGLVDRISLKNGQKVPSNLSNRKLVSSRQSLLTSLKVQDRINAIRDEDQAQSESVENFSSVTIPRHLSPLEIRRKRIRNQQAEILFRRGIRARGGRRLPPARGSYAAIRNDELPPTPSVLLSKRSRALRLQEARRNDARRNRMVPFRTTYPIVQTYEQYKNEKRRHNRTLNDEFFSQGRFTSDV